jgi:Type II secretion system (T2SS), protein N
MSVRAWQLVFFVLALAGFGVAFAPASLVAPSREAGFAYTRAQGTIWNARFEGARLGPFNIGALTWEVSFADLIKGDFKAKLAASGGALTGDATLLADWRGDRRIIAESVALEGAPLSRTQTLAGLTTIQGLDLYFVRGACRSAKGAAKSDVLERNPDVLRWSGPQLAGEAACEGPAARIALEGANGPETVRASVLVHADGAGAWRAEVHSANTDAQIALTAAGFAQSPQASAGVMVKEAAWAGLF